MKNKELKNYKKFYIVAPQCHGGGGWHGSSTLAEFESLDEALDYVDIRGSWERSYGGDDSLRICIDENPNHSVFIFNEDRRKWDEQEDFFTDLAASVSIGSHGDQKRRGGENYWKHPNRVAQRVKSPEEKQVAYLHDVIEDTETTLEDLKKYGFNNKILEAIDILTKRNGQEYSEYLKKVKQNKLARSVKIADMLDNISDKPTEKQVLKYAKGLVFLLED